MLIKNKIRYYLKHMGWFLLGVGIILTILLFIGMNVFYYTIIILGSSFIMQILGWKEPFWFEVDKAQLKN